MMEVYVNDKFFRGLSDAIDRWVDREFGIPITIVPEKPVSLWRKIWLRVTRIFH